ncbi:class I SAM-dependent methyltransferase [Microbacterium amylolyticum]|uniref:16S rRNA G1207 methylase RsmC n=1 Tax=Microbacterium amylolyticum TaxID=936337 RepID=A0ABS4ZI27_9MICO|nr:methyltransferase [Microbacterium amylolyticum]MBP2436141.1 16S rRNA G1207 methylase RsmC [Microbacterium amylolyticum]
MGDHYFSAEPSSQEQLRRLAVTLADRDVDVTTAGGVFSPDRLDKGTDVLLANTPEAPAGGDFLDIGCGWGPIALSMAIQAPRARVWALDVNERALDLVRRNAADLGLENVHAVTADQIPSDVVFRTIRSNPPIRIGKPALHELLETWIPRLDRHSDGYFVVQKNLGSDSLQRWMDATFADGYSTRRHATAKGFRVLKVRHHGDPPTGPLDQI